MFLVIIPVTSVALAVHSDMRASPMAHPVHHLTLIHVSVRIRDYLFALPGCQIEVRTIIFFDKFGDFHQKYFHLLIDIHLQSRFTVHMYLESVGVILPQVEEISSLVADDVLGVRPHLGKTAVADVILPSDAQLQFKRVVSHVFYLNLSAVAVVFRRL